MNIGELKASLRRSGLPATGERRDLERDVLRAAGLRPKTPVPRHVVAAQLRAASPASRARRASQIPEDVLRDLLREEGVSVDGDLVQAAVDAFGDNKEDEDSFFDESDGPGLADGPGVAFARPASPDSDDERRPGTTGRNGPSMSRPRIMKGGRGTRASSGPTRHLPPRTRTTAASCPARRRRGAASWAR